MSSHPIFLRVLAVVGWALAACTVSSIAVPTFSVPSVVLPTRNAPAIGLTLTIGADGKPGTASTPMPAIPVTGGADQLAKWVVYGVAALILIVLVIAVFARLTRGPGRPGANKPDI